MLDLEPRDLSLTRGNVSCLWGGLYPFSNEKEDALYLYLREWPDKMLIFFIKCIFRGFPRPDLGPNIGPFPIKNEQKLPKMVYIIPDLLVLHLGENFMKIRTKLAKLRCMKICIKMWICFLFIFMQIFMGLCEGQLKHLICYSFTLLIWYINSRESKPHSSDFYQNNFLSTREYQTHGAHSVNFW